MQIETKHNIKDSVFFIKHSKVLIGTIYSITIDTITDGNVDIHYEIINKDKEYHTRDSGGRLFKESWLFKTKEELIASL